MNYFMMAVVRSFGLPRNDLITRIKSLFSHKRKSPKFRLFRDYQGNFHIEYPEDWRFDPEIAMVEGKYSVSFESPSGPARFVVTLDSILPFGFDFEKQVKETLGQPTSGFCADIKATEFRGMKAFSYEYCYQTEGRRFFAGGLTFFTGWSVFSLNWSAPEQEQKHYQKIFDRMLETLTFRRGILSRRINALDYIR